MKIHLARPFRAPKSKLQGLSPPAGPPFPSVVRNSGQPFGVAGLG
jgi:hypothetical protein